MSVHRVAFPVRTRSRDTMIRLQIMVTWPLCEQSLKLFGDQSRGKGGPLGLRNLEQVFYTLSDPPIVQEKIPIRTTNTRLLLRIDALYFT